MEIACACGAFAERMKERYPVLLVAPSDIEAVAEAEGWTIRTRHMNGIVSVGLVLPEGKIMTLHDGLTSAERRFAIAQEVAAGLRDGGLAYCRVRYGRSANRCCYELAAALVVHGWDVVNGSPATVVAEKWDVPVDAVVARRQAVLRMGCRHVA